MPFLSKYLNMPCLFTLICSLFVCCLQAQYVPMPIPLSENSDSFDLAWAGGLNLPQYSEIDLNNDGIMDLVVYDREGDVASTFINGGTPGLVDYHYAPEYMKRIPKEALNFMLFRDYNCDGIQDIFGMYVVYAQGIGVAVWQGSYDADDTIQFNLITPMLEYAQGTGPLYKMFIYNTDLPSIDDIDGDGDLDILGFTLDFIFPKNIYWYKNTSVEDGNGCDSLDFVLENQCWGQFEETGDSSKVNFSPSTDSCFNNPWYLETVGDNFVRDGGRNQRHIGANITTQGIDGDNIKEAFLGGVTFKNLNKLSGVDINDTVLMNQQDLYFPSYDKSVNLYTFVSTFFLDVNNDGLTDMLVCPSETGVGEALMDSVTWMYQNIGTNSNMNFSYQQNNFLVGDMFDVGMRAFPAVFDYNADGLNDLLIGGFGRPQSSGGFDYGMTLLENIGTLTDPAFEIISRDYAGLGALFLNGLHPTFGDIDADGDIDMFCGAQDGSIVFLENTAGAGNTANWAVANTNYKGIDVGDASAPFLVDIDRDNDLDLLIGQYSGTIYYYENGGSPTNPNFNNVPVTTNLGGYSLQTAGSRNAMPFVHDNNGAYEMFIGHQNGNFIQLGNIDADVLGVYDTLSESFKGFYQGKYTDIALTDLNNDNKMDYILGTGRGGLMVMTESDTLTVIPSIANKSFQATIAPNPVDNNIRVQLYQPHAALQLKLSNALGQILVTKQLYATEKWIELPAFNLASGVYYLEISTKKERKTLSFIKKE